MIELSERFYGLDAALKWRADLVEQYSGFIDYYEVERLDDGDYRVRVTIYTELPRE